MTTGTETICTDCCPQDGQPAITGTQVGQTCRWRYGGADASTMAGYWSDKVYGAYTFEARFDTGNTPVGTPDLSPAWALGSYAENAGSGANVVGHMMITRATADNSKCWAFNAIATSDDHLDNCVYIGGEVDIQPPANSTPAAGSSGILINGFGHTIPGAAIQINGIFGGSFPTGIAVYGPGGGLAGGAGGSLTHLVHTGNATYANDTPVILNEHHRLQLSAAAGNAHIRNDGGFLQIIPGGGGPTILRNHADTANALTFNDNGQTSIGSNANAIGNNAMLDIANSSGAVGNSIALFRNLAGYAALEVQNVTATAAPNGTPAAARLWSGTNGRSLNASGTLNASGADYAEYERKNDDCPDIAKGQIIGFDNNGCLTDRFDEATRFAVKSTNPNMVGGDFANDVGERPIPPVFTPPAYAGTPFPGVIKEAVQRFRTNEDGSPLYNREGLAVRRSDAAYHAEERQAQQEFDLREEQWRVDTEAHCARVAELRAEWERTECAAYEADHANWNQSVETARAPYDRISYCGKVPVNVSGAQPGQYVVPVNDSEGGITADLIDDHAIDFAQYRRAVGKVHRVLNDGRAEIVVKSY